MYKFFLCISSLKTEAFTSTQDQNDQKPILHILWNTFHQRKCFVFVIICNYLGWPHGRVPTCTLTECILL